MKINEVKCPNCGANLVYDSKKHKYECEYCKTCYIDSKDDDTPDPRVELTPDDLKMVPENFKKSGSVPFIVMIIFFIIFVAITIFIFSKFFEMTSNFGNF